MYITYYQQQTPTAPTQLTFEELLRGITPPTPVIPEKAQTKTIQVEELSTEFKENLNTKVAAFFITAIPIINRYPDTAQMSEHYRSFNIPKHSGGMRTIDAPDDQLKKDLRDIKDAFEDLGILSHTYAYAYVPGRCAKDAIERHQKTGHKWYLKMDLHNFFGSCTPEFIMRQITQIGAFSLLSRDPILEKLIALATLNGGLPQGTPLSPWLTNQIMLPIDFVLSNFCQKHNVTYTRYADDMLFSADSKTYLENNITKLVRDTLRDTPLTVNETKTKISSINGQNWNLGLMVNKDNNITVGYRKKEIFKATITNFCFNHEIWTMQDTMEFLGTMQYYISVEPDYFQNVLTKYGEKFNMDIRDTIIRKLRSN